MILMSSIWNEGAFRNLGSNLTAQNFSVGDYISTNSSRLATMVYFYYNFEVLNELQSANLEDFYSMVALMYGDEWQKLYDLYNAEYNPLANKDLVETEKISGSDTLKRDDTLTAHGDSNFQRNDESSASQSTTYDKLNYVPTTKVTNTGGSETHSDGNSSLDRTDKTTYGKMTEFTSKGNIGVMPTQDLFDREVELRLTKHLEDIILSCVVDSTISGVFTDGT